MAVTPPPRTHRPVWNRTVCRPCATCSRQCPTTVFPEQADEPDSLRGMVARKVGLATKPSERPPCVSACPLGQDVPGYLRAEADGDFDRALEIIHRTNPFAAVCGRLCHHPCQRACVRKHIDEPVQIRALKLAAVQKAAASVIRTDSKNGPVTVVGGGPAGLSAAYFLARAGFQVTVCEAEVQPGGLLSKVIPAFDLPPEDLEADLEFIRSSGVDIQTGIRIGSADEVGKIIKQGARAVVLAVGASKPRYLKFPGQPEGVQHAVTFCSQKSVKLSGPVVVAGSGIMAASAARLAARAGAGPVSLLFKRDKRILSAEPEGIGLAEKEGIKILVGTRPVELIGEGSLRAVACEGPHQGKIELEAKTFIDAEKRDPDLGFLDLSLSKKGSLELDSETGMTATPGVFAAGECVTGPRNVIRAIANGMQAAAQVSAYLSGGEK